MVKMLNRHRLFALWLVAALLCLNLAAHATDNAMTAGTQPTGTAIAGAKKIVTLEVFYDDNGGASNYVTFFGIRNMSSSGLDSIHIRGVALYQDATAGWAGTEAFVDSFSAIANDSSGGWTPAETAYATTSFSNGDRYFYVVVDLYDTAPAGETLDIDEIGSKDNTPLTFGVVNSSGSWLIGETVSILAPDSGYSSELSTIPTIAGKSSRATGNGDSVVLAISKTYYETTTVSAAGLWGFSGKSFQDNWKDSVVVTLIDEDDRSFLAQDTIEVHKASCTGVFQDSFAYSNGTEIAGDFCWRVISKGDADNGDVQGGAVEFDNTDGAGGDGGETWVTAVMDVSAFETVGVSFWFWTSGGSGNEKVIAYVDTGLGWKSFMDSTGFRGGPPTESTVIVVVGDTLMFAVEAFAGAVAERLFIDTITLTGYALGASVDSDPQDTILLPADGDTYTGDVTIQYVLSDPDSNTCTTIIQFSKDGGSTWQNMAVTDTADTGDIYAPTFGDTKIVVWKSKVDLVDTRVPSVRIRVIPSDYGGQGIADTTLRFGIDNADTIRFRVTGQTSNGTHDTSTASFIVQGTSTGDSQAGTNWDTVFITFGGLDSQTVYQSETYVWACTGNITFKDKDNGVQVIAKLFRNRVQVANDTLTVTYDVTKPRLVKVADSGVEDGDTATGSATATFYVLDTGAGFDGNGSCTLYWHIDSGANTNFTAVEPTGPASGTFVIQATIPTQTFDTKIGFWWGCHDDLNNIMDTSIIDTVYLVNKPGTYNLDLSNVNVKDIVISEVHWASPSGEGEFIELYNTTASQISLTDFVLRDRTDTICNFTSADVIASYGFLIVMDTGAVNDTSSHTTKVLTDPMTLANAGDSVTLYRGDGLEIDSAAYPNGWPGGSEANSTVSMERIMSGANFATVGYGGDSVQWDTHNQRHGHGGRAGATPGHHNSVNVPYLAVSPTNAVEAKGRAKWTITVTNGRQTYSSGRIVVKVPYNWSDPQSSDGTAGKTTVSIVNGSGSAAFSGDSILVNLSSWTASSGQVTITYGDNSGNRDNLATTETDAGGVAEFQLFHHSTSQTANPAAVADSGLYSVFSDTLPLVELRQLTDTDPTQIVESFLGSKYLLSVIARDLSSRPVYGANIVAEIRAGGTDSNLSEYDAFGGFYAPSGNGTKNVRGYTSTDGKFTCFFEVSATAGGNEVLFGTPNKLSVADSTTYFDTARPPVPVINEIGWDGENAEFIEIYNPTHQAQSLTGYKLFSGLTRNAGSLDINTTFSGTLDPFRYFIIVDNASAVQDSGRSPAVRQDIDAMDFDEGAPSETIYLQNAAGDTVDFGGSDYITGWFNISGSNDSKSLERIYPDRSGVSSSSWDQADSVLRYGENISGSSGAGSPGRPNSQSLSRSLSQLAPLDTFIGKDDSMTDTLFDTSRLVLTLKLASGDTQPYVQIGVRPVVDAGPFNYRTLSDSSFIGTIRDLNTPESTTLYGTALVQVTTTYESSTFSGTVHVYIRQPWGFPDTAYVVFDRGDSLGYRFKSSDTNIFDTSPANALVVFVNFSDSFSGLDSNIMPRYRWKFGTAGTYSTLANMRLFEADTYFAQIDVSSNTYALKSADTIFWQFVWRDKAGNWDTSPDNHTPSSEFINNTRPYDTRLTPTVTDTRTLAFDTIQILIGDYGNQYCTVVVKFDSYSSGLWTTPRMISGDTTDLISTQIGETYTYTWDLSGQFPPDTRIPSVRLRIEIWDGFDTYTETSGFFGVNTTDTIDILTPDSGYATEFDTGPRVSARVGRRHAGDSAVLYVNAVAKETTTLNANGSCTFSPTVLSGRNDTVMVMFIDKDYRLNLAQDTITMHKVTCSDVFQDSFTGYTSGQQSAGVLGGFCWRMQGDTHPSQLGVTSGAFRLANTDAGGGRGGWETWTTAVLDVVAYDTVKINFSFFTSGATGWDSTKRLQGMWDTGFGYQLFFDSVSGVNNSAPQESTAFARVGDSLVVVFSAFTQDATGEFYNIDTLTIEGGVIGTVSVDSDPQDTLLALPTDGETYSANVTIQYWVSDPDSNTCTTIIQFSKDGGTTWQNLTVSDTTDTGDLYAPTFGDTKTAVWRSKADLSETRVLAVRIRVMPRDFGGNGIEDTTLRFGIDNQECTSIAFCTAIADVIAPDTGVYLYWRPSNMEDSKGYNVYRSVTTDTRVSSKINTSVIVDSFGFKDSSGIRGDTYYYYVTVVDTYDNESDSSIMLSGPNLIVLKSVTRDSSNPHRLRPGDTFAFQIQLFNNGFAPAVGVVVHDYVPDMAQYTETATVTSIGTTWIIQYRVSGASGEDVWQTPVVDSSTIVRMTRSVRIDPRSDTLSDTLRVVVKIQ